MSIHNSLVPASALRRHRNVLKRSERIEQLQKEGRWADEKSVFGLPKVRNILMKAKKTKKEEAAATTEAAAAAPGAAPTPGATPAAGAKGAAPSAKGAAPAAGKAAAAPAKKEEKKK